MFSTLRINEIKSWLTYKLVTNLVLLLALS